MKNNTYNKNTLGKYAIDFLGKKTLIRKARRKARQADRKACKTYVG